MIKETEAEQIIAHARSKLGSHQWDGYCQKFVGEMVADIFRHTRPGYSRQQVGSAANAQAKWQRETDQNNIPLAAAVYFRGSGKDGHVGIYSGNGRVIHAWRPYGIIESVIGDTSLGKGFTFEGWGYEGGLRYKPTGALTDAERGVKGADSGENAGGAIVEVSGTATTASKHKDITAVVTKYVSGGMGARKYSGLNGADVGDGVQLLIQNDETYAPVLVGSVSLTRQRNAPATLTFEVLKDEILNFNEGNPVALWLNGEGCFYGYVFKKERGDDKSIKVTCYDQLRYLKNKDTFSYRDKTYAEVVKMIADDYGLKCDENLIDTGYRIGSRIEEGTLLDACLGAAQLTLMNTGRLFVLYDDWGEIKISDIESLVVDTAVEAETAQSFSYATSIDNDVYNRVKLAVDNDATGEREVYISQDADSQSRWGVLGYYDKTDGKDPEEIKALTDVVLNYYNRLRRTLTVRGCVGNTAVRGGTLVPVMLNLGDIVVNNMMMVEKAVHKVENGQYFMDLTLVGVRGEFVE